MKITVKKQRQTKNADAMVGLGLGLLAGAATGGLAAILLAPRSGRETRSLIRTRSSQARRHMAEDARRA